MAAINSRDVALAATSPRTVTVRIPGTVDWNDVGNDGGNKANDNADVTQTAVNLGVTCTAGGITISAGGAIKGGQTAYATGTGWFLGYSGAAYKFSIGSATKYLTWDGTSLTFAGDLTGAGTINWTGPATFTGTTAGAVNASLIANSGATVDYGVYAPGTVVGVRGDAVGASAIGIHGKAGTGTGVHAEATSGTALKFSTTTGKLMDIPTGKFSTGTVTPTFNNKPGAGTTVNWIEVYDSAGAKWWIPAVKDA